MKRAALAGALALALACAGDDPAPGAPGAADPSAGNGTGAASAAPTPWFADVTRESGLDFAHDMGATPEKLLPETMGGGGALLDGDGDGDLDLFLVQSGPVPTSAERASGRQRPTSRLFANDGAGRFRDVTERSGAAAFAGCGMGVAAGDVDGDGRTDLYVTCFGPDALLAGAGPLVFRDATEAAGLSDERWTAGAVLFDADGDADLDLYVTGYLDVDVEEPAWCGRQEPGWRSYCHPDRYEGLRDRFWRNGGGGTFADATRSAGLWESAGKGLGAVACDVDGDGDLDVYVANDSVENQLWINAGDGTFTDETLLSGTGVNAHGATEAGMGLACADVDGDLDLDLFVTNLDHESNTLYVNEGRLVFRDGTLASGLEGPSRMPVGFGCVLEDFDQDGRVDLAVANGHIIDNIELYDQAQAWRQRAQVFAGLGDGRFRELPAAQAGALAAEPLVGRGLLAGDVDGDLDLDLVVLQCGGPARLLRNDAARGGALRVEGVAPGALVELELASGARLLRSAGPAPSYLCAGPPGAHFGLGGERATRVRLREPGRPPREHALEPALAGGTWRPER